MGIRKVQQKEGKKNERKVENVGVGNGESSDGGINGEIRSPTQARLFSEMAVSKIVVSDAYIFLAHIDG